MSLPLRERGLKCFRGNVNVIDFPVAPLAGAWIEIDTFEIAVGVNNVAPLAGAWIEMSNPSKRLTVVSSLPLRERGLKLKRSEINVKMR